MLFCMRTEQYLQGGVQVPTGGRVRERIAPNRCDSGTDSKVWMEEGMQRLLCVFLTP